MCLQEYAAILSNLFIPLWLKSETTCSKEWHLPSLAEYCLSLFDSSLMATTIRNDKITCRNLEINYVCSAGKESTQKLQFPGGGRQYLFRSYGREVFGLLGPNGAGKTTTVEMIEGIRQSIREK